MKIFIPIALILSLLSIVYGCVNNINLIQGLGLIALVLTGMIAVLGVKK